MAVTNFFWDELNLLQEFNDSGVTVASYLTDGAAYGNVISQQRSGQTHYFHSEASGSVTELTNVLSDTTDAQRYKAFGRATEQAGSTSFPWHYIGQSGYYRDAEIGCCYVRRRSYEYALARWKSADPLGPLIDQPNVYSYAVNSPMMYVDPSGLKIGSCGICVVALGAHFVSAEVCQGGGFWTALCNATCKTHFATAAEVAACVLWCKLAAKHGGGCLGLEKVCLLLPTKQAKEKCLAFQVALCLGKT